MDSQQEGFDKESLRKEIKNLGKVAATADDRCITAKFIALSDKRVSQLVLDKGDAGNQFEGIRCDVRWGGTINVVFEFSCPIGRICIVDPSFAAVVNMDYRQVMAIIDPYLERDEGEARQLSS